MKDSALSERNFKILEDDANDPFQLVGSPGRPLAVSMVRRAETNKSGHVGIEFLDDLRTFSPTEDPKVRLVRA